MEQSHLISVIVPVYNMEQYLDRCVQSILHQTYSNLEIILVDDGSVDKSPAMCDDYAQKDGRVKVVHKKNGGLSDARNAGLRIATGSYIGYVDSDDWIEPDMYESMYLACERENADLVVCRYKEVYKNKTIDKSSEDCVVLSQEDILNIYLCGHDQYQIYNSVWSKLFKRQLVEDMDFPVGHNSEDIMYTTKAFCRLTKAVYIDRALYNYVLDRDGSIMNDDVKKRVNRMFDDEIPFWKDHITCISEMVSENMGNLAAYNFYKRLLFYFIDLKGNKNTSQYAYRIVSEINSDRKDIKRVYKNDYIKTGDKVRMQVMLFWPWLYYFLVVLYDRIVIPMKVHN